jgi:hypothetical protein
MNRAQKIMTSVMASLAVTGQVPSEGRSLLLSSPESQEQPDPRVTKAADDISTWLEPVRQADAKSLKEIAKKFPQYRLAVIQKALKDERIKHVQNAQTAEVRYFGHGESAVG